MVNYAASVVVKQGAGIVDNCATCVVNGAAILIVECVTIGDYTAGRVLVFYTFLHLLRSETPIL